MADPNNPFDNAAQTTTGQAATWAPSAPQSAPTARQGSDGYWYDQYGDRLSGGPGSAPINNSGQVAAWANLAATQGFGALTPEQNAAVAAWYRNNPNAVVGTTDAIAKRQAYLWAEKNGVKGQPWTNAQQGQLAGDRTSLIMPGPQTALGALKGLGAGIVLGPAGAIVGTGVGAIVGAEADAKARNAQDTAGRQAVENTEGPVGSSTNTGGGAGAGGPVDYATALNRYLSGQPYALDPSLDPARRADIAALRGAGAGALGYASGQLPGQIGQYGADLQTIRDAAAGRAPSAAEALARAQIDQNIAGMSSVAGQARGGNIAAAMRAAQQSGQTLALQSAPQIAALRANEMATARGQLLQGNQGLVGTTLGYGQLGGGLLSSGVTGYNQAGQLQVSDAAQAAQAGAQQAGAANQAWGNAQAPTIAALSPDASKTIAQMNNDAQLRNQLIGGAFSAGGAILGSALKSGS